MTRTFHTTLLGYPATLEQDEESINAYYNDGEYLIEAITIVTREASTVHDPVHGTVKIPEETDIVMDLWHRYFDALVAWTSGMTGIPREDLAAAWHPDLVEPWIAYDCAS